jgi:Zn-dependent protease with chaperone function
MNYVVKPSTRVTVVPSGTTLRFATLAALVVATALFTYSSLFDTPGQVGTNSDFQCQAETGQYMTFTGAGSIPSAARTSAFHDCLTARSWPHLVWLTGGLLVLLVIAGVSYLVIPAWRIRRRRMRPVPAELRPRLDALVGQTDLAVMPTFLVDPTSARATAAAFGHRRSYVCLHAGLVVLAERDPASFDVVVLHELAHVRNRDIPITYATIALWRAFLVVALLPWLLSVVDPFLFSSTPLQAITWDSIAVNADYLAFLLPRIVVLYVLVVLARASVLRSRERHADARMAAWAGDRRPAYEQLLTQLRRRRLWWLGTHPSGPARLRALHAPDTLLRPGFWETLTSAVAVQLAIGYLTDAMMLVGWTNFAGNVNSAPGDLLWCLAVAVIIAVTAWRAAVWATRTDRPGKVFATSGAAIGVGLALGELLTLDGGMAGVTIPLVIGAIMLVAGTMLVTCWAGRYGVMLGHRMVSLRGLYGLAVIGLACWWPLSLWTSAVSYQMLVDQARADVVLLQGYARGAGWAGFNGPVLTVLAEIWNFDYFWVAGVALVVLSWLGPLSLVWRQPSTLRAGLSADLAWLLVDATLRLVCGLTVNAAVRAEDGFGIVFSSWEIAAAVVVHLVLGWRLAIRRATWPWILFAGTVTSIICCVGLWSRRLASLLPWASVYGVDNPLTGTPQRIVPILGLLAVAGGAMLGGLLRHRRPFAPVEGRAAIVPTLTVAALLPALVLASAQLPPPSRWVVMVAHLPSAPYRPDPDAASYHWAAGGGNPAIAALLKGVVAIQNTHNDDAGLRAACVALDGATRQARTLAPPPADADSALWLRTVDSLTRVASTCVRAIDTSDQTLWDTSTVPAFRTGSANLIQLSKQINVRVCRGLKQLTPTADC